METHQLTCQVQKRIDILIIWYIKIFFKVSSYTGVNYSMIDVAAIPFPTSKQIAMRINNNMQIFTDFLRLIGLGKLALFLGVAYFIL